MRAFFVTLFPSLGAVYGVNATYGTIAPSLEATAELAATQGEADVVVSDNTLYQRGWTRARLAAVPTPERPCPDLFVLGSSAVGTLSGEMFSGRRVVNGWHGNFSVQDMESFTAVMEAASCKPQDLVIGIDLFWSANGSWKFEGWQQLASDYAAYHAQHGGFAAYVPIQVRWDDYKEKLGFERTLDTVRAIRQRGFQRDELGRAGVRLVHADSLEDLCAKVEEREQNLRAWDGHYLTCPPTEPSEARVATLAREYLAANIHSMADWHEIESSRLERIDAAIGIWRARGINVVMLGVPYHPITWQLLTTDTTIGPNIVEVERRLQQIAGRTGAKYLSLRDPSAVPCDGREFDDSHHPRPVCMHRVAEKISAALVQGRQAAGPDRH